MTHATNDNGGIRVLDSECVEPVHVATPETGEDAPDFCCWPDCNASPNRRCDDLPLCERHYFRVGKAFVEFRTIWGSAFRRELAEQRPPWVIEERVPEPPTDSVVYYVRIGDHIKIGFSSRLHQRLQALRVDPDRVLATEPGDRDLELKRHHQFADERVGRRENFNPSRRLLAHIEALRAEHGEPSISRVARGLSAAQRGGSHA